MRQKIFGKKLKIMVEFQKRGSIAILEIEIEHLQLKSQIQQDF